MLRGEELAVVHFPQKVVELQELIDTHFGNEKLDIDFKIIVPLKELSGEMLGNKFSCIHCFKEGFKSLNGVVPCNQTIVSMHDIVKKYTKELLDDANVIRVWISLMIPQVDDGNNLGVEVLEYVLTEVIAIEDDAKQRLASIASYYCLRADLVAKMAKCPYSEDYQKAIEEEDSLRAYKCMKMLNEVKNNYAVLHDLVMKNLRKIKQPRPSSSGMHFA
ncbi:proteasome activator complex subunit 3-like protein [Dinothrombium tinctorium]|nr:proteasome activator complex subunit 3-like protein [Dinothrombium tinctorium]RWS00332.1 proteasome activator complex subunit 3-like protein [Dinothrombium tinctorium]